MKKNVLVVAQFTQLPGELGNNRGRFKLICELLCESGYEVTLVTSKFRELDRTFRAKGSGAGASYRVVLLNELGYSDSISFRRGLSMFSFSVNLKKYLANKKFDLVYCCVPGLDSSYVAGSYAMKRQIPFVIDVQDVWPECMYDLLFNIPVLSKIAFSPWQFLADRVYNMADGIIAVSETYLEIARKKNSKSRFNKSVFIGTNLEGCDNSPQDKPGEIEKHPDEFWISYIGSLSHSYDILTFLEAAKIANQKGMNVRPIIMGCGPLMEKFIAFAKEIDSNAIFTGWIDHTSMRSYLHDSDAVINAIKKKAPQSITNKIGDYLSSGKMILNGSLNKEFLAMVDSYDLGLNYEPENSASLASAIEKAFSFPKGRRSAMGENSRKLAEEKFDRKITYPEIIGIINSLLAPS